MTLQFTACASDIAEALGVVRTVSPRALTPQGGGGFLFVVHSHSCSVYSRDTTRVARATFPLADVQGALGLAEGYGCGAFVYPDKAAESFSHLGDQTLRFEVTSEGSTHKVSYSAKGVAVERTTLDPRILSPVDKDVEASKEVGTYSTSVLREALTVCKAFLPDTSNVRVEEVSRNATLFDASKPEWERGNGVMMASDGSVMVYFQCDELKNRGLSVHAQHLPAVLSFLSKSGPTVQIRSSGTTSYLLDRDGTRMLGWTHPAKLPVRFSYPPTGYDKYRFLVPARVLEHALRFLRTELDAKQEKIRLVIDVAESTVYFKAADTKSKATTFPVTVSFQTKGEGNLEVPVSVHHMQKIITGSHGNDLDVRVAVIPHGTREVVMVRTLDQFGIDRDGKLLPAVDKAPEGVATCLITRFLTRMD